MEYIFLGQKTASKSKITEKKNPSKTGSVKFFIKWQNQKLKHIKRMNSWIQVFQYVENGGLNLVLQVAKPPTCMTVAQYSAYFNLV